MGPLDSEVKKLTGVDAINAGSGGLSVPPPPEPDSRLSHPVTWVMAHDL